eukprot:3591430-Pleurochrysis_carterae.AAC.1
MTILRYSSPKADTVRKPKDRLAGGTSLALRVSGLGAGRSRDLGCQQRRRNPAPTLPAVSLPQPSATPTAFAIVVHTTINSSV